MAYMHLHGDVRLLAVATEVPLADEQAQEQSGLILAQAPAVLFSGVTFHKEHVRETKTRPCCFAAVFFVERYALQ